MNELKHHLMMNKEHSWVFVYCKYEADKVIAEKDAEIRRLKNGIAQKHSDKSLQERLNEVCEKHGVSTLQDLDWAFCESEKRHTKDRIESAKMIASHKYKRCLAMTDKCGQAVSRYLAEGRLYEIDAMTAEGERHNELLEQVKDCDKAVLFYDRWYHRWSKIAEQCKC